MMTEDGKEEAATQRRENGGGLKQRRWRWLKPV
jgi:hypothetical protein